MPEVHLYDCVYPPWRISQVFSNFWAAAVNVVGHILAFRLHVALGRVGMTQQLTDDLVILNI